MMEFDEGGSDAPEENDGVVQINQKCQQALGMIDEMLRR
jgi:hypothetical protein